MCLTLLHNRMDMYLLAHLSNTWIYICFGIYIIILPFFWYAFVILLVLHFGYTFVRVLFLAPVLCGQSYMSQLASPNNDVYSIQLVNTFLSLFRKMVAYHLCRYNINFLSMYNWLMFYWMWICSCICSVRHCICVCNSI